HILFAALWVGSAVFLTLYVTPAIRATGPRGAPVMAELMRRRTGGFIAAAAMLTVLSGLWMYWVFTHGFDSTIVAHGAGLALGIGGLCGIAAAVIGGAVIGGARREVVATGCATAGRRRTRGNHAIGDGVATPDRDVQPPRRGAAGGGAGGNDRGVVGIACFKHRRGRRARLRRIPPRGAHRG